MASVMESGTSIDDHSHLLSVLMKHLPVVAFRRRNDPRWSMEQISEGCRELTGYSPDTFLRNHQLPFADIIHPDDRQQALAHAQAAARTGRCFQLCYRITTAKGEEKWVSEHARAVEEDADCIEGILTDVTDQKLAEQQAFREKRFADSVIDSLPGVFYMVDCEGNLLRWNRNTVASLGYTGAELKRMQPLQLFDSIDQQRVCRKIDEAFKHGRAQFEATLVSKNGSRAPYFFTSLRTDYCGVPAVIGMGMDISARKEAEEEVKALNRDLESRVARRTAALQAAMQELEAFAYSVSHDLRAPLRHINAFAHILQRNVQGELDEANTSNLDAILAAAQRMDQLINDLLLLSRAGRQEMRHTSVDLEKLVELVRAEMAPETMGREVEWKIGELPMVEADGSLLRQVFINLLSNAIKYTRPRAKAVIEIGAEEKEHEHVIYVRDNGVGFDAKYAHRLFGVFQRLHSEREFEGTGIGLAIVRRIVSRHGGAVWAEGKLNEGAAFYFTLPKAAQSEKH